MSFVRRLFQRDRPSEGSVQSAVPAPLVSVEFSVSHNIHSDETREAEIDTQIVSVGDHFNGGKDDVIQIDDPAVREQLLALASLPISPAPAFGAMLLGQRIEWHEFDRWHADFRRANDWPRSWIDAIQIPNIADYGPYLAAYEKFRSITPAARFVVLSMYALGKPRVTTHMDIVRRVPLSYSLATQGIHELERMGFIRPSTQSELLARHTVAELKQDLERIGSKKTGNKPVLIERLIHEAPPKVIQRLVPDDLAKESVTVVYPIPLGIQPVQRFEETRVDLASSMMSGLLQRKRLLETVASWERSPGFFQGFTVHSRHSGCAICRSHDGRQIQPEEATIESLPPYHPGCDCWAEQHYGSVLR
jgi:hypothetical protein